MQQIPGHVAIILDGNGRWAEAKRLPRYRGHMEGVKRVREIVRVADREGVRFLTLFVFSTENWKRPGKEVGFLMAYFKKFLSDEVPSMIKQNVRLRFIGKRDTLPSSVRAALERAEQRTQHCSGMTVIAAFNYGSREEILNAVVRILKDSASTRIVPDEITESYFERYLYTSGIPDPDLLIRTSGEKRISNFLLWQLSYAELYFPSVCWPDFHEDEFKKALHEYGLRKRRFGAVS